MMDIISTNTIPTHERFDYWHEVSKRYFVKLDCLWKDTKFNNGFQADLKHISLGKLDLIDLAATPHSVQRMAESSNEEFFFYSLLLDGSGVISQGDRIAKIAPGDMILYDTRHSYKVDLNENFRLCSLRIPVSTMKSYLFTPENFVGMPLTKELGLGRILGAMITNIFNELVSVDISQKGAMANSVMDMLSVGLQALSTNDTNRYLSKLSNFHLDRVKDAIEANLTNIDLSVTWLSKTLHMSVSSVHRSFEHQPFSVTEYIWNRRLEACKRSLENPSLHGLSVCEIAYHWGFTSNAHFSRAFKRYTGFTPRDFRQLSKFS